MQRHLVARAIGLGRECQPSQYTIQSSRSRGAVIRPVFYPTQSLYRDDRVMDTPDRLLHARQEKTLINTNNGFGSNLLQLLKFMSGVKGNLSDFKQKP